MYVSVYIFLILKTELIVSSWNNTISLDLETLTSTSRENTRDLGSDSHKKKRLSGSGAQP